MHKRYFSSRTFIRLNVDANRQQLPRTESTIVIFGGRWRMLLLFFMFSWNDSIFGLQYQTFCPSYLWCVWCLSQHSNSSRKPSVLFSSFNIRIIQPLNRMSFFCLSILHIILIHILKKDCILSQSYWGTIYINQEHVLNTRLDSGPPHVGEWHTQRVFKNENKDMFWKKIYIK